jgi:hypothetical protein
MEGSAPRKLPPSFSRNQATGCLSAELFDSVFIAAWDYEETPDEDDEEVESLDEGFHLDIAQESDDEQILEIRRQPPEDESDEEEDNE